MSETGVLEELAGAGLSEKVKKLLARVNGLKVEASKNFTKANLRFGASIGTGSFILAGLLGIFNLPDTSGQIMSGVIAIGGAVSTALGVAGGLEDRRDAQRSQDEVNSLTTALATHLLGSIEQPRKFVKI